MREIKFRAWADGKMHYQTEEMWWFFGSYNYWSLNRGDCPGEIICDSLESEGAKLMQYTGKKYQLKDSKGVEIYEGDILKAHHPDHLGFFIGEVRFNVELLTYYFDGPRFDIPMNEFEDFEIIGNVHEHPELLPGKE
ncbi:MAG TPA: YopX family protein [Candidatus Glassbacteria bacterium]|nr:YopX family protein [Candidatus Glassbacteria bacterium]